MWLCLKFYYLFQDEFEFEFVSKWRKEEISSTVDSMSQFEMRKSVLVQTENSKTSSSVAVAYNLHHTSAPLAANTNMNNKFHRICIHETFKVN